MAKIDVVKANITFLQVIFALLFGAELSLIGWVSKQSEPKEELLGTLALAFVSVILIFLVKTILKKIKSMEDL